MIERAWGRHDLTEVHVVETMHGFNDDPVGFLNFGGLWTPLLDALHGLVDAGFIRPEVLDDLVVADDLEAALAGLAGRLDAVIGDKLRG
jgi:predicted Rossmann-fold nucleotide-binding protein